MNAIESTIKTKSNFFHKVFKIDTSNKNQDEVGKEVTERTIDTLKDLLMERIGYFEISHTLREKLMEKKVFIHDEIKDLLPEIHFDLRNKVEENIEWIQPIPVAIITNEEKNKVLVIKKNKGAVSDSSPEKDKILLYIGGHSRYEDATEMTLHDVLAICRTTLKREVKEEIGISIALSEIEPFYIYSTDKDKSKQHLAVCFPIALDEEGIKLRLDSQELVLHKGKSKSGKFLSLEELQNEQELETWSKIILRTCFNEILELNRQFSLFDNE